MRNLWLVLSVPLSLAACTPQVLPPPPTYSCTNQQGGQPLNIHYGDSQIKVTPPLFQVRKNRYLKFHLIADNQPGPGNLDYATVTVTIKSKDPLTNQWINVSGTEQVDKTLSACMPTSQPLGVVEYLVEVEDVGQLDPRAEVIP